MEEEESKTKRVTVVFNLRDLERIEGEVARRTAARGYEVSVSEVLRDLIRDNWSVPANAPRPSVSESESES